MNLCNSSWKLSWMHKGKTVQKLPREYLDYNVASLRQLICKKIMLNRFQGSQFFRVINNFGNRMNEFLDPRIWRGARCVGAYLLWKYRKKKRKRNMKHHNYLNYRYWKSWLSYSVLVSTRESVFYRVFLIRRDAHPSSLRWQSDGGLEGPSSTPR